MPYFQTRLVWELEEAVHDNNAAEFERVHNAILALLPARDSRRAIYRALIDAVRGGAGAIVDWTFHHTNTRLSVGDLDVLVDAAPPGRMPLILRLVKDMTVEAAWLGDIEFVEWANETLGEFFDEQTINRVLTAARRGRHTGILNYVTEEIELERRRR